MTLYTVVVDLPYNAMLVVKTEDQGNGLPVSIAIEEHDPPRYAWASMSVADAEHALRALSEAIKAAKNAGLDE